MRRLRRLSFIFLAAACSIFLPLQTAHAKSYDNRLVFGGLIGAAIGGVGGGILMENLASRDGICWGEKSKVPLTCSTSDPSTVFWFVTAGVVLGAALGAMLGATFVYFADNRPIPNTDLMLAKAPREYSPQLAPPALLGGFQNFQHRNYPTLF